jgi:tetratricopeptide (TPR) repeat protein
MARYDRIAPLTSPARKSAFPAWPTLRDLEGRERDGDLTRRARLRFLALRPVRRLLDHGWERVPPDSYDRQLEGIREELGHLPARDAERAFLAAFLHRIRDRDPGAIAAATLEFGEIAERAGHRGAAGEFYRTVVDVAEVHGLTAASSGALAHLARLERAAGHADRALALLERAAVVALEGDDRLGWTRAVVARAELHRSRKELPQARAILDAALAQGEAWADAPVIAAASAELCSLDLDSGELEHALEHGWHAARQPAQPAQRRQLLLTLATVFARLAMFRPAERCLAAAIAAEGDAAGRVVARAAFALLAAQMSDPDAFASRRAQVLTAAGELAPPTGELADVHLHLGRGCLILGSSDAARDHLREALALGKLHGRAALLAEAEDLLAALEAHADIAAAAPLVPGEVARRIAAEVEALEGELAAAGE